MKLKFILLAGTMCLVSACGGSHDDHASTPPPAPPAPPAPMPLPAPAVDSFFAMVAQLVNGEPDAEPQAVEAAVATTPEDSEPVAVAP